MLALACACVVQVTVFEELQCRKGKAAKTTWQQSSASMWERLSTSAKKKRWSEDHELLGIRTARCRDVVDLGWAHSLTTPLYCDVSQSASQKPWSKTLRSMVSQSQFYSYSRDRLITSREHWQLLGFDATRLKFLDLSPSQVKNLAGEAMAPPNVTLVCML